jgi:hypothetical protein
MGAKPPATTTQVVKQDLGTMAPFYTDLATQAQQAFQSTPKTPQIALPNTAQTGAIDMAQAWAQANPNLGAPAQQAAQNVNTSFDMAAAAAAGGGPRIQSVGGNVPMAQNAPWQQMFYDALGQYGAPGEFASSVDQIAGTAPGQTGTAELNAAIAAALNPLQQRLQNEIIPQVQLKGVESGNYGGDRYGIGMEQAIMENFTKPGSDIAARLAYENIGRTEQLQQDQYSQRFGAGAEAVGDQWDRMLQDAMAANQFNLQDVGQQRALSAEDIAGQRDFGLAQKGLKIQNAAQANQANLAKQQNQFDLLARMMMGSAAGAPSVAGATQAGASLDLMPATVMGQTGDQQQAWAQAFLDAQNAAPWNGMSNYANVLNGLPVAGNSTSATTAPPRSGAGTGSIAQGAMGGAMAGFTVGGPWGALIGALAGAGMGAF